MTAITAVTAQNTVAVERVYPLPPEAIVEQVAAVVDDIGVDAVKIGMLGNVETIEAVARRARPGAGDAPVVLDPVMVAESGATAARARTPSDALRELLVPRVDGGHAERARGRGARRARARRPRPRTWRGRFTRSGPRRRGHRRPPRGGDRSLLRRRPARRDPGRASSRTAPRTARAALTRRRSRRISRSVSSRSRRRGGRRRSRRRRWPPACASSAPAPGPVDVLGLARARRPPPPLRRPGADEVSASGIIGRPPTVAVRAPRSTGEARSSSSV